jgi:hypothetical protein
MKNISDIGRCFYLKFSQAKNSRDAGGACYHSYIILPLVPPVQLCSQSSSFTDDQIMHTDTAFAFWHGGGDRRLARARGERHECEWWSGRLGKSLCAIWISQFECDQKEFSYVEINTCAQIMKCMVKTGGLMPHKVEANTRTQNHVLLVMVLS